MSTATAFVSDMTEANGAPADAIQTHYDVSNAFYALWLDETMTYSCALWDNDSDLKSAQLNKLDFHLEQAHARNKGRLLDIGCGWGALVNRAIEQFGVQHVVGLTLSQAQCEWIEPPNKTNVAIRLESWEKHTPTAPYDAIISIGAFEHFVKPGLSRTEKVRAYRKFFEWCHANSTDSSYLSLQSIVYENFDENLPNDFVKEIFPESDLPRLSEILEAMQGFYEVVTLRNDREHYTKTLQQWLSNLRKNRDKAIALGGEALYRKYEKYLGIFAIGFHIGTVNLTRFAARRISN